MLGIVLAPKNNAQKGLLLIKCECVHIWGFSPYVLQFSKEKTEGFVNMTNPPQPNSVAAVIFILLIILAVILSLLIVDNFRSVTLYCLVVYLDVKLFYPAC